MLRRSTFLAGRARCFTSCPAARNTANTLSKTTELEAAEESNDITTLDGLLKTVRQRTSPEHHSLMPVRSHILWSEALRASSRQPQAEAPSTEHDFTPRHLHDSYCEVLLPFASSPELLEQFTNAAGGIRTGKIMEHLDSLAGSIAYKHMLGPGQSLGPDRGFYIVTASVDRLDVLADLNPVRDMRLSGQVISVGRSSMEVAVRVESLYADGKEETVLLGRFSMVCRDARTHKAFPVNPLVITTPEDEMLFKIGQELKRRRQAIAKRSLSRVPPTSEEAAELHNLYLSYVSKDPRRSSDASEQERVWMRETKLENCIMMFPQERNIHQKIFGGYLMRLAYELGFANTSLFTRHHVRFLSLDGISFSRPVPIGSILHLTSRILHTTSSEQYPTLVHVGVKANVVDALTGEEQTTNDFRFTWCSESGEPLKRRVVPKTYSESMLWLEGKRALELGAEIRGMRRES